MTGRRPELDGLRGVAILLVVFAHAAAGVYPTNRGLAPELESLGGVAGVQLFFVLSGFLITGVLLRGGGLVSFYRRRWNRLYPTLLVVTLVAVLWSGDAIGALRAMTYTENLSILPQGDGVLGHSWSLAVEEQFYLAWPLVLLVARRHAATIAVVGIGATWALQHLADWSDHAVYVGLRWDAVLAGSLLALVPWKGSPRTFALGAAVLAAYTLGLVELGRSDYMVLTVASVAMVASAGSVRALGAGWIGHVGRISYPLYLWHVLAMRLDVPTPVALALGWALAEITYRLIDRAAQGSTTKKEHPMTDPLAHLYAETGGGDPDEELDLPVVETSLEKLTAERGAHAEELSERDLEELVLLVRARLESGGLPDDEAAELGLGEIREAAGADLDRELVLNETGRAVFLRLVALETPEISFGTSR